MGQNVILEASKAASIVYINEALETRAVASGNLSDEKQALHVLAAAMAKAPADVLPRFVELAMTLTEAVSAGLSLYEPEPEPGVFRWRHLHGLLAAFENATTPRNDSPCGVTLDRNRPTLSRHPELVYDWITAENLVIPEVLLVPLYIGSDEPLGTLWVVSEREGHFHRGHADTAAELASFAGLALKMIREEERLRTALTEQELLAREMSHRLKNLFAMTDGMIHGSARTAETVGDFATALSGRLHALADAHSLVQRQVVAIGSDRSFDLAELISAVVKVHERAVDAPNRIATRGPAIPCGDHATNAVALVVHELATNAAKYGALSVPGGRVDISWELDGTQMTLQWLERDGPWISSEPSQSGFGTSLIAMTVERQFGGSIFYDWKPTGLEIRIELNAAKLRR